MTTQDYNLAIDALNLKIIAAKHYAQFADGLAYTQDMDAIRALETELQELCQKKVAQEFVGPMPTVERDAERKAEQYAKQQKEIAIKRTARVQSALAQMEKVLGQ